MHRLIVVGTGRMAHDHARRFTELSGIEILAAVDVEQQRVQEFCEMFAIPHAYTDLAEALSKHQHELNAATIVTPDAWHAPAAIACLQAGLSVLCEKPLSDSQATSRTMVAEARQAAAINMVNLTYRSSGALAQARQLIDEGRLGSVRHIEASYRQSWLCSPYWGDWCTEDAWLWRLSTEHGSAGVLGDIGIHILDYVTAGLGMGISGLQCRLQTFEKAPGNQIGPYKLDANDSCVVNVEMQNGALGVIHMSRYQTGYMNDLFLTVHGTEGAMKVSTGQEGDKFSVCLGEDRHHQHWSNVDCKPQPDTFERFASALQTQQNGAPDFAHAAKLQDYMVSCVESHRQGCWIELN